MHHTYHLPQTEVVKWVAFIVSMMEVIILVKLMIDLGKILSAARRTRSSVVAAAG